jgi:energy-coupling factor transporter transmembrane protein EcfT
MRLAARSRHGALGSKGLKFQAAAGALSVLFARSWERADGIYRSMLARGFSGRFSPFERPHFHTADIVLLGGVLAACIGIRLAA